MTEDQIVYWLHKDQHLVSDPQSPEDLMKSLFDQKAKEAEHLRNLQAMAKNAETDPDPETANDLIVDGEIVNRKAHDKMMAPAPRRDDEDKPADEAAERA